jgi:hypothetical protein
MLGAKNTIRRLVGISPPWLGSINNNEQTAPIISCVLIVFIILPDLVLLLFAPMSGNDTQVVFSLGAFNFHVQNFSLILIPSQKTV